MKIAMFRDEMAVGKLGNWEEAFGNIWSLGDRQKTSSGYIERG